MTTISRAPMEPTDLDDLARRTAAVERLATGVSAVLLIPLGVIGAAALAGGETVVGLVVLAVVVATLGGIVITSWRRYGRRGERWAARLREAASRAGPPREVEVWFVVPSLDEGPRSQRTALVGDPGGRPDRASKLLVEAGTGVPPGRGLAWEAEGGGPLFLEVGGTPLWPARPAKGRAEVALVRFAARIPLSTLTLRRPQPVARR